MPEIVASSCPNKHLIEFGVRSITTVEDINERYMCNDCGHVWEGPPRDIRFGGERNYPFRIVRTEINDSDDDDAA